MIRRSLFTAAVAILMSFCLGSPAHAAGSEEQLIEAVKIALGRISLNFSPARRIRCLILIKRAICWNSTNLTACSQ